MNALRNMLNTEHIGEKISYSYIESANFRDIDLVLSDVQERKDTAEINGVSNHDIYPFLENKRKDNKSGCYLIYEKFDEKMIVPIYAGKTVHFYTRFQQHWCGKRSHGVGGYIYERGWMDKYNELINGGFLFSEYPYSLEIAAWDIRDANERTYFERKLLHETRPYFNII